MGPKAESFYLRELLFRSGATKGTPLGTVSDTFAGESYGGEIPLRSYIRRVCQEDKLPNDLAFA